MCNIKEKIIQYLDFLVQQDTQNPPRLIQADDELFQHLQFHFQQYGCQVEMTDLGDGHVIFYAHKGQPKTLFNVHLDTVPVPEESIDEWHSHPFKLRLDNNKAYGRGTCDIKGAAACLMAVVESAEHFAVVFTTDEEGSKGCCVEHFIKTTELQSYQYIIVAEPTECHTVLGHRGYMSLQLQFYGCSGHSSLPQALQHNAIHRSQKWLSHTLSYAQSYVSAANEAGLCFNVGSIQGGEKNNMIAEQVNLSCSMRVPPSVCSENVLTDLKSFDATNDTIPPTCWHVSMMVPPLPFDNSLREKAHDFCQRYQINPACDVDFWTEAALFSQSGYVAMVLGPGNIKQAHAINEWVSLEQLHDAYQLYLMFTDQEVSHEY